MKLFDGVGREHEEFKLRLNKDKEVAIGKSPVTHKLEPGNSYEVRFEKKGYVTKTEPLPISGNAEERLVGVLSFRDLGFKRPGVGLDEAMTSRGAMEYVARKIVRGTKKPRTGSTTPYS